MLKKKLHIIFSALVAVAVAVVAFLILPQYINGGKCDTEITLEILDVHDSASGGYEMLLDKNAIVDGRVTPLTVTALEGNFNTDGAYYWGTSAGSKITLFFAAAEDIDLHFTKHAWSGIARVYDGDATYDVNLFSASGNNYTEVYTVKSNHTPPSVPLYFLIALLSLIVGCAFGACAYFLIYATESACSLRVYHLSLFLTIFAIWCVYLCGAFPGAMSIDSLSQFKQALGLVEITDAHPAFLTLIYKLILDLTGSAALCTLLQIIFYGGVLSAFLSYLSKIGLSRKICSVFAVIFGAYIVNGIYATVLWKDIPYTVSLMWVTLLLLKLAIERKQFFTVGNIIQLSVSSALVYLLRHNGIVVFLMVLLVMVGAVILFRSVKPASVALVAILLVGLIKGPVYSGFNIKTQEAYAPSGLLHGIVYTCMVTDYESEFLESVMPMEDWYEVYEPYSTNSFAYSPTAIENNLSEKMENMSSSDVTREYLKAFFHHPIPIIKDRLLGCNLMWNSVISGYNWRCANDQYLKVVEPNDMGFYCRENIITDLISDVYQFTVDIGVNDTLIWRAGPYLSLAFILLLVCILQKKLAFLLAYIPIVGNSVSLVLAMAWQDYRYVYYMFALTCMLVLSYFAFPSGKKKTESETAQEERTTES